jgi:hypothetical protein
MKVDSREKLKGASSLFWEKIIEKVDSEELVALEKFIERLAAVSSSREVLSIKYLKDLWESDISSCLSFEFKPKPFMKRIALAMLNNSCYIERAALDAEESPPPVSNHRLRGLFDSFAASVVSLPDNFIYNQGSPREEEVVEEKGNSAPSSPKNSGKRICCSLCGKDSRLKYRFRIDEGDPWDLIDSVCRSKLVTVGNFFGFINYLRKGFYSQRPMIDIYFEMLQWKRAIFYARVGKASNSFFIQSDFESFLKIISAPNAIEEDDTDVGEDVAVVVDKDKDTTDGNAIDVDEQQIDDTVDILLDGLIDYSLEST